MFLWTGGLPSDPSASIRDGHVPELGDAAGVTVVVVDEDETGDVGPRETGTGLVVDGELVSDPAIICLVGPVTAPPVLGAVEFDEPRFVLAVVRLEADCVNLTLAGTFELEGDVRL